jgi:hypothetical protein
MTPGQSMFLCSLWVRSVPAFLVWWDSQDQWDSAWFVGVGDGVGGSVERGIGGQVRGDDKTGIRLVGWGCFLDRPRMRAPGQSRSSRGPRQ